MTLGGKGKAVAQSIPCTVAMLTFNSGATLARALASVADVAEVIIADGGSTDDTVEVARRFNRTVVRQDPICQDRDGRLVDYGAAREQVRLLATQPWVLQLDSDEYASLGLIDELKRVCESEPGGPNLYTVPARYEVDGALVDCATTYPMSFPRLYRRAASSGYVGVTHERAVVSGDTADLQGWFVIPFPPVRLVVRKWRRYLRLDAAEARSFAPDVVLSRYRHQKSQLRWFARDVWRKQVRATCQHRLPVRYEVLRGAFYAARFVVFARERLRRRVSRHQPPDQVTVD